MSYYEYRIKVLEERVAQLALEQRMKAIPVEAKLVERIALLQAENKALRKAGDAMADEIIGCYNAEGYDPADSETLPKWNAAKEGKQS